MATAKRAQARGRAKALAEPTLPSRNTLRGIRFKTYAPPLNAQMAARQTQPNPPFAGAKDYQCSYYYWWWEFLRRHHSYKATCAEGGRGRYAQLFEHMGDVHDPNQPFLRWFAARAKPLFAERNPVTHITAENADQYADCVLIAVRPNAAVTTTLSTIERLLKRQFADREIPSSSAAYPVIAKPSMANLHRALMCWDMDRQGSHTNLEIAEAVGLQHSDPDTLRQQVSALRKRSRQLVQWVARTPSMASRCELYPGLLSVFPYWPAKG